MNFAKNAHVIGLKNAHSVGGVGAINEWAFLNPLKYIYVLFYYTSIYTIYE